MNPKWIPWRAEPVLCYCQTLRFARSEHPHSIITKATMACDGEHCPKPKGLLKRQAPHGPLRARARQQERRHSALCGGDRALQVSPESQGESTLLVDKLLFRAGKCVSGLPMFTAAGGGGHFLPGHFNTIVKAEN